MANKKSSQLVDTYYKYMLCNNLAYWCYSYSQVGVTVKNNLGIYSIKSSELANYLVFKRKRVKANEAGLSMHDSKRSFVVIQIHGIHGRQLVDTFFCE